MEWIQAKGPAETFAEQLDPTVRTPFKQCFDQANDPQYEGP
jgi:hypothetical protein